MKKLAVSLILFFLLALLPGVSLALSAPTFVLTTQQQMSADTPARVEVYKKSTNSRYIFLPSGWDASSLKIWFTGYDTLTVNGAVQTSGSCTSAFQPGHKVTIEYGKNSKFEVQVLQSADVASVFVSTSSGHMKKIHASKVNFESGKVVVYDAHGNVEAEQELEKVRARGNSSFKYFEKKSYQIKMTAKKNLFGMGKAKTWLLIGNARDHSHLRNYITCDMAKYVGLKYTPDMVFADLYTNGEYRGLYLLSEKIEVGENRVDISNLEKATESINDAKLSTYKIIGERKSAAVKKGNGKCYNIPNDPEDISGGYLLELDGYFGSYTNTDTAYMTPKYQILLVHSPEYCSKAQFTYIKNLFQSFENAIFSVDGIDPVSGKHYSELGDVDSLVLKYTLEEVVKNYDANRTSSYFYKESDDVNTKFCAGPVWDYDAAYGCYGTSKYPSIMKRTGFSVANGDFISNGDKSRWWPALCKHLEFTEAARQAYNDKFRHAFSILLGEENDISGRIRSLDQYAAVLQAASAMDSIRWPYKQISPNIAKTGKNLKESVAFLKEWLTERRAWLDTKWVSK